MRERIRELRQRLLAQVERAESGLKRGTQFRQAAYAFLRRARSIDKAIWLLLDNQSVAEAAILFRSQLNLLWCFLFMVDARTVDGRFQFDSDPDESSNSYRRAAKYLSWQWVQLYRVSPSPLTKKKFDCVIRDLGYASEADVPEHWYQEGKIRHIKHLAETVGALAQYEEDYSHLSGIEHSDITAVIVEGMESNRYGDFIAFKSSQALETVMDFTIPICGCTPEDDWKQFVAEFNTVNDQVARERPARDGA